MSKLKVAVVTGTRAEFGLLEPLITALQEDTQIELQIIVTGMHLSAEFGFTYKVIEARGFDITYRVDMLVANDTPAAITKSIGLGAIGFADAYDNLKPDWVVVLGDRYEILAAVQAAAVYRIPVAHIHGGELTEGAIDDCFRHAITKMAYLHFTATEIYRQRVIQLGEEPGRVFHVGAMAVDSVRQTVLLDQQTLEQRLGISFDSPVIMVTYHSDTMARAGSEQTVRNLLQVLDQYPELTVIFTGTNSDTRGRVINELLQDYVASHSGKSVFHLSLGSQNYYSALQFVDVVLGNSSSGIIEAPLFAVPTVNIGDRQRGRVLPESVIQCGTNVEEIKQALEQALSVAFHKQIQDIRSPYEAKVPCSEVIVQTIKQAGICADKLNVFMI